MVEEPVKKGIDGEEEEPVSEEELALKKKQIGFEKKKASGELELEKKDHEKPGWFKWVILGLVILGMAAMIYFMGLV